MIHVDSYRGLTDEEKSLYKFEHCVLCAFHESCELLSDYIVKQAQKNVSSSTPVLAKPFSRTIPSNAQIIILRPVRTINTTGGKNSHIKTLPQYMHETWVCDDWGNVICSMKRDINQVECGDQLVAAGIGDDFKVDIKEDYKTDRFVIDESSYKQNYYTKKWEPCQPVFISAQTGKGKNTFVEKVLLAYVRELNHKTLPNIAF